MGGEVSAQRNPAQEISSDLSDTSETIFTGAGIMLVGAALQASSFSLAQLIAARIVTGLGNGETSMLCSPIPPFNTSASGFITATVPVWQSECAKASFLKVLPQNDY